MSKYYVENHVEILVKIRADFKLEINVENTWQPMRIKQKYLKFR